MHIHNIASSLLHTIFLNTVKKLRDTRLQSLDLRDDKQDDDIITQVITTNYHIKWQKNITRLKSKIHMHNLRLGN